MIKKFSKKRKVTVFIGSNLSVNFEKNLSTNLITVLTTWGMLLGDIYAMTIVSAHKPPDFLKNDYHFHKFSGIHISVPKLIKDILLMLNYLKKEKPDLILHISNPNRDGIVVCLAGRLWGIPTMVRATGDTYNRYKVAKGIIGKIRAIASLMLAHIAYKYASRTICLGPVMQKDLEKRTNRQIDILPLPVDTKIFFPAKNKSFLKHQLDIPISKIFVLFVGRLEPLKGSDMLFNIIAEINEQSDSFFFGLIGDGPDKEKLASLEENITLFGSVPHKDIHRYYKAADVLILPSKNEGLPNVLLEALACGLPVLATNTGEISAIVSNICSTYQDFVRLLLRKEWLVDNLPDYYKPQEVKKRYVDLFNALTNQLLG